MALEYRNGRPYYYHKVRQRNKVISEYMGSGANAGIVAELVEDEQEYKRFKQELFRKEKALHQQADNEIKDLEKKLNQLFTCVAIANGYHNPKRTWRKKRQ